MKDYYIERDTLKYLIQVWREKGISIEDEDASVEDLALIEEAISYPTEENIPAERIP